MRRKYKLSCLLPIDEYHNSYQLDSKYGGPLSREETINLFDSINMTNTELLALNEYILKDENNSFYDDFDIYDENGYPLNFTEANRFYDEIAQEMIK